MNYVLQASDHHENKAVFQLLPVQKIRLGRDAQLEISVTWDRAISREHASVQLVDNQLQIDSFPAARNPIQYQGKRFRKCRIDEGDIFKIGSTEFHFQILADSLGTIDTIHEEDNQVGRDEHVYLAEELHRIKFANSEQQIEILAKLPEIIRESENDIRLAERLVDLLLEAIPQAHAVAVVVFDSNQIYSNLDADTVHPASNPQVLPKPIMTRVGTREDLNFRFLPSHRLMLRALSQRGSVIHVWGEESESQFTMTGGLSWAFCSPVIGESSDGWCLYVSGAGTRKESLLVTEEDLAGDLRFTELVAQFIGSIRQVRTLQEHRTRLSSFFSPNVIQSLSSRQSIQPAECDIAVLFCDIRGFSRKAEELRENLPKLLESVSEALEVMANGILDFDGTIADFQGDAALGFWGWPVAGNEGAAPALLAAMLIGHAFDEANREPDSLLRGFSVGFGVSFGKALAGQVGTSSQSKIGVFGPIVNQGARLEGMTKLFGTQICVDEAAVQTIGDRFAAMDAKFRKLGRFYPKGMHQPLTVYSLQPSGSMPESNREVYLNYDRALEAIEHGLFEEAAGLIGPYAEKDKPSGFLLSFLDSHDRIAPENWDGIIPLPSK